MSDSPGVTISDDPMDYSIQYALRPADFHDKRQEIIKRGIAKATDPDTMGMIEALKDETAEMKDQMHMKLEEKKKEIHALQERLDTANATIGNLSKIVANYTNLWPVSVPSEPTIFRLLPDSMIPYHGEKDLDRVCGWIKEAERVLVCRAYETSTVGSTENWAMCAIDYLRGQAFAWAKKQWLEERLSESTEGHKSHNVKRSPPIGWEDFKREFIRQHVPPDAIVNLHVAFEHLELVGSLRKFNQLFRHLSGRLKIARNETDPVYVTGDRTEEEKRRVKAAAEKYLILTYASKLHNAGEIACGQGKINFYSEWIKRKEYYARQSPPYCPTLDQVMEYMEDIEKLFKNSSVSSGFDLKKVRALDASDSPTTPVVKDQMFDFSKVRAPDAPDSLTIPAMKDRISTCTHCNRKGHEKETCWHLIGFPDRLEENRKTRGAKKRKYKGSTDAPGNQRGATTAGFAELSRSLRQP